jgi:hypothetical protein
MAKPYAGGGYGANGRNSRKVGCVYLKTPSKTRTIFPKSWDNSQKNYPKKNFHLRKIPSASLKRRCGGALGVICSKLACASWWCVFSGCVYKVLALLW